jgi:hypothetical protein
MTLMKQDTAMWNRNHWIATSGELALDERMDLSQDKAMNE